MNPALKSSHLDSTNPQEKPIRIIGYRAHVKWMYYGSHTIAVVALLYMAYTSLTSMLNTWNEDAFFAVYFSLGVALVFAIEAHYFLRPLAFLTISVYPDRVALERFGKSTVIPYAEITKVRFSSLAYLGGWFSLQLKNKINGHEKYRFTVVLERSERLLDALFHYSPGLISEQQFHKYRRTAIYADHAWARVHGQFKNGVGFLTKYIIYPLALALFCNYILTKINIEFEGGIKSFSPSLLLFNAIIGFCIILGTTFYVLSEYVFGSRLRRQLLQDSNNLMRDMKTEQLWYRNLSIAYYVLTILMGGLIVYIMRY